LILSKEILSNVDRLHLIIQKAKNETKVLLRKKKLHLWITASAPTHTDLQISDFPTHPLKP
jgi:hypothetical protein